MPKGNTSFETYNLKKTQTGKELLNSAQDLANFYDAKIKPKLDKGQIHSVGQGVSYLHPGFAGEPDEDVSTFLTQTGPLSLAANAYYNQVGGSRGGISLLQMGTQPHVPHPPGGLMEVLSTNWDLPKQRKQLQDIIDYVKHQESGAAPRDFGGTKPAGAADDPYGLKKHGLAP